MKDLDKKELELFEYYKEKTEFINVNSNLKIVKDFLANLEDIDITQEDIEFYIKTPLFQHASYKTKSGLYIVQYSPYYIKYTYTNYEEFIKDMFLSDKEQENPLYGIIEGLKKYQMEELKEEFDRYKIRNKVRDF